ncbi:MAG TPA: putative sulfate exporter family transporter, partial [Candidatus Avamphibacillus sp.]|nr:putative sulfate exporter family transporter [Candidatus Avamphibacillus sp.]
GENSRIPKWYKLIPLFVIGFLLLALVRTIGDMTLTNSGSAFGFLTAEAWENFYTSGSSFGTTYMLGIAMAGVGLSTDLSQFKGLGMKPFYIGLIAALSVGIVSLTMISLFGHLVVV